MPPPPLRRSAIVGEGAVAHGQRAAVEDAAATVVALLPENVLLLTVSVPKLPMPPPFSTSGGTPIAIVNWFRLNVTPRSQ